MTKIISRKDLLGWLSQLLEKRTIIAPVRTGELVVFAPISSVDDIVFEPRNTTLSPKNWFFPPSESLFTMISRDGATEIIPTTMEREAVLFGLHPCDARGITVLDKPFLSPPADTLYAERRDKTALVGLACTQISPECFCTSMGIAPNDPSNLDILLTEVKEGYLVQANTKKGEELISSAPLSESGVPFPACPSMPSLPTEDMPSLARRVFEHPYWVSIGDRCVHCNTCAYVCPVCYCFDIRDYRGKGQVVRVRSWESCQSPGFTRSAGGYDPRADKKARIRQRFYHKLLYMPEQFQVLGCTGCGRCVRTCPVNIDIREIIQDIAKIGVGNVS